jgi:hypothetical protein
MYYQKDTCIKIAEFDIYFWILMSISRHMSLLSHVICVTKYYGYVPLVVNTSHFFPHSWFITGFVTRLTRRVSLVEQELFTFRSTSWSRPFSSGVRVTRSLILNVCFVDRCWYFFFWPYCVVCPSLIYGFWLPLGIVKLFLGLLLWLCRDIYNICTPRDAASPF